MTSKLKCLFCQQELRKLFNQYTGEPDCDYECGNYDCDLYGIRIPETVWQALIQEKKQLERAKWWLKEIVENHRYTPITTAEMALKELEDEQ